MRIAAVSASIFFGLAAAVATVGAILTGAASYHEYRNAEAVAQLRLEREADEVADQLQQFLSSRVTIFRVIAALFRPADPLSGTALDPLRAELAAILPARAIAWVPKVMPDRAQDALRAIRARGGAGTTMWSAAGNLDPAKLSGPVYPVLDLEPFEENRLGLGVDVGSFPERSEALRLAAETGQPVITEPIKLSYPPYSLSVMLFVPVLATTDLLGFLSTTFDVARTGEFAFPSGAPQSFAIRVLDGATELFAVQPGEEPVAEAKPAMLRVLNFGGRTWTMRLTPASAPTRDALRRAALVGGVGGALTGSLALIFVLLGIGQRRLVAEVGQRRQAQDHLRVVVSELNHRAKNMISVIQALVSQSLRPGRSFEEVRELLAGRLRAMAHATTLLTQSEARTSIRMLVSPQLLPTTERLALDGPDLVLGPKATQALALLIYELGTNSAKHGALGSPEGTVDLSWRIEGDEFRLAWSEKGGPPVRPPKRRGFGCQLLERITPATLGGRATTQYEEAGFRYTLDAPAESLLA